MKLDPEERLKKLPFTKERCMLIESKTNKKDEKEIRKEEKNLVNSLCTE